MPIFAALFYLDNGNKYINLVDGMRGSKKQLTTSKAVASFSVVKVFFAATRFGLYYQLLLSGARPYVASMASSVVT
jgi:hypothetical protein